MIYNTKIYNARQELLILKQHLLDANPNALRGNSKARLEYSNQLEQKLGQLTQFQLSVCIGLLLSDASAQKNANGKKTRLKIQQSKKHILFLEHILCQILPEWCAALLPQSVSVKRQTIAEIQTLTHSAFNHVFNIFYISVSTASYQKVINPDFYKHLDAVAVAYWFAGDGGKVDYSSENRKAIALHTQGFNKDSINNLVDALHKNFGWKVTPIRESIPSFPCPRAVKDKNQNKEQWWLSISGADYDNFILKVGPYIPVSIAHKLPLPRSDKSVYGFINKALKKTLAQLG